MTSEPRPEAISELQRRFELIMDNFHLLDPIERGSTGSSIAFETLLAPIGYPFKPAPWMDDEYLKPVMSNGEYDSGVYDWLFEHMMKKVQKKTKDLEKTFPWEKQI